MPIGEFLKHWRDRHEPIPAPEPPLDNNLPENRQEHLGMMTLAEFIAANGVIRVRSRLLGEDVWWVSGEGLKPTVPDHSLVVYTAAELHHLVGISPRDLVNIHRLKKTFDGHIEN